ncbi:hypothetical protein HAX54_045518 [Datura stramonium]|uniref:Uncharacterized protein n=1 Tax=Datura stramonium TaxID=4076 RepID=A0ABS8WJP6_DATST|nr:hypothetical protein [Datura stramonium]
MEEVNYEVLKLKAEGQHQNLVEAISCNLEERNNLCLSDEFCVNIKKKLKDTIEILEDLEKQIGCLGLREYPGSEELVGHLISDDANSKKLTVMPIIGMAVVGKITLAKAIYNDETCGNSLF